MYHPISNYISVQDFYFESCRLQIWKYWTDVTYQLIYEYRTTMPGTEGLSTWDLPEPISLASGMRIGWTLEEDFHAIAYDFEQGYRLYYRQVTNSDFPILGGNYTFQNLPYPAIYSISVTLDTRKYLFHNYIKYIRPTIYDKTNFGRKKSVVAVTNTDL